MNIKENPQAISVLMDVAGANSIEVVNELLSKKEIDEFSLAEMIGMEVKLVRKILYSLYDQRLVTFKRMKDEQTGWYIYIWKFDNDKLEGLITRTRRTQIKKLREQLEYEQNGQHFVCESGCVRVKFEEAMAHMFNCPHCSGKLDFFDNTKVISQLEDNLKQMEKSFGF
ncbi:MAG: transcription factor E [Candidatus Altiarchaeota archaeon]|nr:transcription factor E [Candidatus Altiarchaeota archaeon]